MYPYSHLVGVRYFKKYIDSGNKIIDTRHVKIYILNYIVYFVTRRSQKMHHNFIMTTTRNKHIQLILAVPLSPIQIQLTATRTLLLLTDGSSVSMKMNMCLVLNLFFYTPYIRSMQIIVSNNDNYQYTTCVYLHYVATEGKSYLSISLSLHSINSIKLIKNKTDFKTPKQLKIKSQHSEVSVFL